MHSLVTGGSRNYIRERIKKESGEDDIRYLDNKEQIINFPVLYKFKRKE